MSDDLTTAYLLGAEQMRDKLHKQADAIERLRAENEELRMALKPFAAAIVSYDDPDIDSGFTIEWDIYPKDLEAARKALESGDE